MCGEMFQVQNFSKLCVATIPPCGNKYDCLLGKFSLCVDKECRCEPNYRFDRQNVTCSHFVCQTDLDCQQHDYNRVCQSSGICTCKAGFNGEDSDKVCLVNSKDDFKVKYFWHIVGTLLALLLVMTCCCYKKAKCRIICAKKW